MPTQTITPRELHGRFSSTSHPILIDVRTPAEFREVHADGAELSPLDALDPKRLAADKQVSADKPLYLLCKSGQRAAKAAQQFSAAGMENIYVVEGGTAAWEAAGLPVVRGKKTISLDRQVRIVAGSLILIGVILGYFVHHYLFGLSAFIGAGLLFAGLTDTCGMAMMLAKMPWNQVKSAR